MSETHQDLAAFVDEIEKTLNTEVRHMSNGEFDYDDDDYEEEQQFVQMSLREEQEVDEEEQMTEQYEALEMGAYKRVEPQELDLTYPLKEVAYCDNLQMYDCMELVSLYSLSLCFHMQ